jgi:hypothetical protein
MSLENLCNAIYKNSLIAHEIHSTERQIKKLDEYKKIIDDALLQYQSLNIVIEEWDKIENALNRMQDIKIAIRNEIDDLPTDLLKLCTAYRIVSVDELSELSSTNLDTISVFMFNMVEHYKYIHAVHNVLLCIWAITNKITSAIIDEDNKSYINLLVYDMCIELDECMS